MLHLDATPARLLESIRENFGRRREALLMGGSMEQYFNAALKNIALLGDTDIFPFPVENQIFRDERPRMTAILLELHKDFVGNLRRLYPINQSMLTPVGYAGFRSATQVDPLWNAYLLGLVLSIGEKIESTRVPLEKRVVFSYRYKLDKESGHIFDRETGWVQFQARSIELAQVFRNVLSCDISDFYPRIYHHRLENALHKAAKGSDAIWRIKALLKAFSKNVSYGLPVGGPAARLLSELLLNRVDKLLLSNGVTFCRFADDYRLFASSEEEAYRWLVFLSEKLLENEGLLLQKAKTRIMSSDEFLATTELSDRNVAETVAEEEAREFLRLRLHYDPYSQTRDEDYEALQGELSRFDVVGMLARELRKGRIHQPLTKHLVAAIRHLNSVLQKSAIASLLENLGVLYPVFPNVALVIKSLLPELDEDTRQMVFVQIRRLVQEGSYIIAVPVNLAYAVRILAYDESGDVDEILTKLYRDSANLVIRRDIILAMASRGSDYWISDIKNSFATVSPWEKASLLIASYALAGDEGRHWRDSVEGSLSPFQRLILDWASRKTSRKWEVRL